MWLDVNFVSIVVLLVVLELVVVDIGGEIVWILDLVGFEEKFVDVGLI